MRCKFNMSSFKKVARSRGQYKERSQPAGRKKLGLLEKHKDYVLRAKDYHAKEKRLRSLREKAALRNPDEFYFAMQNAKTEDGAHIQQEKAQEISEDMAYLIKTQDFNYIKTKLDIERKIVERLKQNLHNIEHKPVNKHIIFVDSKEEMESFSPTKHFDTTEEFVSKPHNRIRASQLEEYSQATDVPISFQQNLSRKRKRQYKELEQRQERAEKLHDALFHVETQRNLLKKGTRKKIQEAEGDKPAAYVWSKERQR